MEQGFPKTSCSLWDNTNCGPPLFLHLNYYRKPKVCIPEKVLKLIQHQCENYGQSKYILVGTLVVEEDGEGVQFQVARLDTRTDIPTDGSGLAPGDLLIPLDVTNNQAKTRNGSVEDYAHALNRLQARCCSKDSIDLSSFLLLRGWGSFYSNAVTSVAHLDFDMVTMGTVLKAMPINPVPIVLTALSKNLAGPMSLSHMQGTPKSGFLTMDHTRKLLLVLESDPKTATLPIVGIWVSGAGFVQHPFVWAACLRYVFTTHLQDRVCVPPDQFLLVLYSPLHSRPEFYQCCTVHGNNTFQFELCSGHDVGNLTKSLSTKSDGFTEVELESVENGEKLDLFDTAKAEHISLVQESSIKRGHGVNSSSDDIEPRSAPTPHMEKVMCFKPMVPDVSILWNDTSDPFPQVPSSSLSARASYPPHTHASPSITSRSNMYRQNSHLNNPSPAPHMMPPTIETALTNVRTPCSQSQQLYRGANMQQAYSNQFIRGNEQSAIRQSAPAVSHQNFVSNYSSHDQINNRLLQSQVNNTPSHFLRSDISSHCQINHNISQNNMGQSFQPKMGPFPVGMQNSVNVHRGQIPQPQVDHLPVQMTPFSPHNFSCPQPSVRSNSQPFMVGPGGRPQQHQQHTVPQPNMAYTQPPTQPPYSSQPLLERSSHQQQLNSSQAVMNKNVKPLFQNQNKLIFQNQNQQQSQVHMSRPPMTQQEPNYIPNGNKPTPQRYGQPSSVMFTPSPTQHLASQLMPNTSIPTSVNMSPSLVQTNGHTNVHVGYSQAGSKDAQNYHQITTLKTVVEESSASPISSVNNGASSRQNSRSNNSSHNSSHDSSSSRASDEDSGLSITPDRQNPPPAPSAHAPPPSSQAEPLPPAPLASALSGDQWAAVPPEVRLLLIQQNDQLQLLQQQMAQLMASQSLSTSAQSQGNAHGNSTANNSVETPASKQCSVGSNTSFVNYSCNTTRDTTKSEHTKESHFSPRMRTVHPDCVASPVLMDSPSQREDTNGAKSGNTPADIRNHGQVPVNSTRCEPSHRQGQEAGSYEPPGNSGTMSVTLSSEEDTDHRALVKAAESIPVYEHSMNTQMSDMMLDMPEYASTSESKSQFDRSPTSVSDFFNNNGEDDSYSTVAEEATDPKQYYSQLMNNIQMFLTSEGNEDTIENYETSDPKGGDSQEHGLDDIHRNSGSSSNTSALMTPQLNYMSMLMGYDPGQSMEINAMAMKYLGDEQLTHMAKLRQGCPGKFSEKILQKVISQQRSLSYTSDVSVLGGNPSDMTMGTRNYLEKHGLLGSASNTFVGSGAEPSFFDHSMKLKTDFSCVTSIDQTNGWQSSSVDGDVSSRLSQQTSPVKSSHCRNFSNSNDFRRSDLSDEGDSSEEKWLPDSMKTKIAMPFKDLGASPVLQSSNQNVFRTNVLRKEKGMPPQVSPLSETSTATSIDGLEDENLLDIEKLKQLPKLL